MSEYSRCVGLLRRTSYDLMVEYEELLRLRAEVARLLFPLKKSPPRKRRITRSNRMPVRVAQRIEQRAPSATILPLQLERPPT